MYKNLLNVFFPDSCLSCSTLLSAKEKKICLTCRADLPITNFHFLDDVALKNIFYGRLALNQATSLFYFHKHGKVQKLIHQLKYKQQEALGSLFGAWLGLELVASKKFETVDLVIGVPIHKKKLRKRGYNQVTLFGATIAKHLNVPYFENILVKKSDSITQVFKSRSARWKDKKGLFCLNPAYDIDNKHILLVDDVITTGATIERCADELLKARQVQISIATIAATI